MGDLSRLFSWGSPHVGILRSYLVNCSDSPWNDSSGLPAGGNQSGTSTLGSEGERRTEGLICRM